LAIAFRPNLNKTHSMKRILCAIVGLSFCVSAARGVDAVPTVPPGFFSNAAPRTVEQRFQDADIALALAQYEKLQMAAFEIRLKLQIDPPASDEERVQMVKRVEMLRIEAAELRAETIKRGATAFATQR
jgi:hypothetical protein